MLPRGDPTTDLPSILNNPEHHENAAAFPRRAPRPKTDRMLVKKTAGVMGTMRDSA